MGEKIQHPSYAIKVGPGAYNIREEFNNQTQRTFGYSFGREYARSKSKHDQINDKNNKKTDK